MDWTTLAQSDENIKKVKKIQKEVLKLSDDVFYPASFQTGENSAAIFLFLATEYELNTQRTYVVAINNCLKKLGLTTAYTTKLTELNAASSALEKAKSAAFVVTEKEYSALVEQIDEIMASKTGLLGVKVMCALLKYDVEITLLQMINAKLIPSENYYDGSTWHIDGATKTLDPLCNAYLKTLATSREYLVVDSHGQKYDHIKSLSKSFNLLFQNGFLKIKNILKHKPALAQLVFPKKVLILKRKLPDPEPLVVKKKLTFRKPEVKSHPWDHYKDDSIREVSNFQQHRLVKGLTQFLLNKDNEFYYGAFESVEAFEQIKTYLESPNTDRDNKIYSLETQKNYINALCKFLHHTPEFNAAIYDKYCKYRDALKVQTMTREKPGVVEFTSLLPTLAGIVDDKKKVAGFRVICSLILNNINLADDEEADETPGVLRMSDLKYTRFQDDNEHSFLDLEKKKWYIKSKYTKNKDARTIDLPEKFIADIKKIYKKTSMDWLLINKAGERYESMNSLSNMFQTYIGEKFMNIRASYTTYRHKGASTVGDITKLCSNMGHSMRTVQADYVRN
jgi:hypothetical protein